MSRLSGNRGCLVCKLTDNTQKKAPLDDILAVIIAARGVSFSGDAISALTAKGAVILHCDDSYRPLAKTVRLSSVIHKGIFERQIARDTGFYQNLWTILLRAKAENQATLLDVLSLNHPLRERIITVNAIDEGNLARLYWKYFFEAFGTNNPKTREYRGARNPVNQKLNYGYAVLGAILHRSIVGHGLNPSLGIHHRYRFKSNPLVYDLIEPLRPFCDALLVEFCKKHPDGAIEDWAKYAATGFTERKVGTTAKKKLKFLYAIDYYVSNVAECFCVGKTEQLFIPRMTEDFIEKR